MLPLVFYAQLVSCWEKYKTEWSVQLDLLIQLLVPKYYGSLPWTARNHIMQQNPGNMESLSLVPGEWISGMQPNIKSKGQKLESWLVLPVLKGCKEISMVASYENKGEKEPIDYTC